MSIELTIDAAVATITLNVPHRRNALTFALRHSLREKLLQVAADKVVRAVVLTGAGTSFCSGADVEDMQADGLAASRARMVHSHELIRTLYRLDKPVIAAVRGHAVGFGWSLALACDFTLAAESAKFSQIFTRIGLAPDGGSVYFLMRNLGQLRAKELVYSRASSRRRRRCSSGSSIASCPTRNCWRRRSTGPRSWRGRRPSPWRWPSACSTPAQRRGWSSSSTPSFSCSRS